MGLSVILKICSVSAMWRSVVGSAVIWLQEISRYRRASICISVERERERGGSSVVGVFAKVMWKMWCSELPRCVCLRTRNVTNNIVFQIKLAVW